MSELALELEWVSIKKIISRCLDVIVCVPIRASKEQQSTDRSLSALIRDLPMLKKMMTHATIPP